MTREAERRPGGGGVPDNDTARITRRGTEDPGLFDHHQRFLGERAVSPQVAKARGYSSTVLRGWLRQLGFSVAVSELIPGLLIPVWDVHGSVAYHQYHPDKPRLRNGRLVKYETPAETRPVLDCPPQIRGKLADPAIPLWVTESPVKADAAVSAGLVCIGMTGAWGWRGRNSRGGRTALACWEYIALAGRDIYLVPDSDVATNPKVADAVTRLGAMLSSRGATVWYVTLPPGPGGSKTGLDDYLAWCADGISGLLELADDLPPARVTESRRAPGRAGASVPVEGSAISGTPPAPCSLAEAEKVYSEWLHDDDPVPTRAVLAAYVANMCLDGDPVWLMLVGGSGVGKTERIMPVTAMPHVVLSSTITGEAALLSATPRKDRAESATGGLLRQLGDHGMLVLKDFTSVLSMSRDARAAVLAALREVYDGRWDRSYGSDGGQVLTWAGKCGLLAGCTTAIDSAHSVLAAMGTRFVFVRLPAADLGKISKSALSHMGQEQKMRTGLAEVTAGLLANLPGKPHPLGAEVTSALVGLACLASQARSPVQRDWKGEIELVLDAEAPTRMIKQLGQLWRACGMLGLSHAESWDVVYRAGIDSVPKLRGAIIRYLAAAEDPVTTTDVGDAVDHPTRSALRALEDLAAHNVVTRITAGQGHAHKWELSDLARSWHDVTGTLPEMADTSPGMCTECGEPLDQELAARGYTEHPNCGDTPW